MTGSRLEAEHELTTTRLTETRTHLMSKEEALEASNQRLESSITGSQTEVRLRIVVMSTVSQTQSNYDKAKCLLVLSLSIYKLDAFIIF